MRKFAARHFADDGDRVAGIRPELVTSREALVAPAILIGTLGASGLIDELVGAERWTHPRSADNGRRFRSRRSRIRSPGRANLVLHLLPMHPRREGNGLRIALGLNDQPPQMLAIDAPVDSAEWAQGVLNSTLTVSTEVDVPSGGEHVLKVYMVDAGVILDRVVLGVETSSSQPRAPCC